MEKNVLDKSELMRAPSKKTKKILLPLLLAFSVSVSLLFPFQKAYAQLAVIDAAHIAVSTANGVILTAIGVSTAATAVSTAALVTKEYILDTFVYAFLKILIRTFTQGIVSWIRTGGFQGQSLMIDNFEEHFKREIDNAAGIFLEDIAGPEFTALLCDGLRITIPRFAGTRSSFANRARCTITRIVDNLENFHVRFSYGGWAGWNSLLQANNNWMGVLLMTKDEGEKRKADAYLAASKKIDTTTGGLVPSEDCDRTSLGHIVNCVTKTPGKIVAKAAEDVFGSGVRQLELADEINEIIAAALDQLISWAITGGGGGFSSGGRVRPPDNTLPTVRIVSPAEGAIVRGPVTISANAFDNVGIARVKFFVDGREIAEVNSPPYATSWDTTSVLDGIHIIMAVAIDTSGLSDQSLVSVNVSNNPAPAAPPEPPPPPPGPPPPLSANGSTLI